MSVITKDLGVATAYGYAKSKGYTGTEEEFAELMASYANVAQQAEAAAQDAEDAKDEAVTAKTDAQTAKTAAQAAQSAAETASGAASTKASEAAQSAQVASGSATAAQTSVTAAAGSAQTAQAAAQTATTKASEASSSASAASTAKTGAETARTGAQTAQTAAETAQANAEAAASSVSASAAQIEQNTDEIAELKNDFNDIAVVNSEYVQITQNSDIISTRSGYSASNTGWNENSGFISYYFITNEDVSIYWESIPSSSTNYTQLCIFSNCSTYTDASSSNFVTRVRNSDGTLPTENNKLLIASGSLVVVSVWVSAPAFSMMMSNDFIRLNSDVQLASSQVNQVLDAIKKPFLRYTQGTGNDSSTERIDVFIPVKVGYVVYQFVHSVDTDKNANVWRMGYAMAYDDSFTKRYNITTQGEWECAVHLDGRSDFSGGLAHGDEIYNSIGFWLDGKKITTSDFNGDMYFSEFVVTEASTLYDPADSTTVIAQHGSKHIFNVDGLVIEQVLNWNISDALTACYLAMFPPAKAVTDAYYTNANYSQKSISSYPTEESRTTDITIYSTTSGVTARFAVGKYPTGYAGGDLFIIHDNGTGNYNKCYYAISYLATPAITSGTKWESKTIYEIDVVS